MAVLITSYGLAIGRFLARCGERGSILGCIKTIRALLFFPVSWRWRLIFGELTFASE